LTAPDDFGIACRELSSSFGGIQQTSTVQRVTSNDRISVAIDNGVADVRLLRSKEMNAIDSTMFAALIEVGESPGPTA
jgi:hypothetical protein